MFQEASQDQQGFSQPMHTGNGSALPNQTSNRMLGADSKGESTKKFIPIIAALAFLLVVAFGFSVFFGVQSSNRSSEIANLKDQLSSHGIIVDGDEINQDQTKTNLLLALPKMLNIISNKCLNCSDDVELNSISSGIDWGYVRVSVYTENPQKVHLTINERVFNETTSVYSDIDVTKYRGVDPEVEFTEPVADAVIATFGLMSGYETVLFLMEDGTVEYMPLYAALKNDDIRSYGKIENVSNIIKFYPCYFVPVGLPTGGSLGMVAQRADGDYYDLFTILRGTGHYSHM